MLTVLAFKAVVTPPGLRRLERRYALALKETAGGFCKPRSTVTRNSQNSSPVGALYGGWFTFFVCLFGRRAVPPLVGRPYRPYLAA